MHLEVFETKRLLIRRLKVAEKNGMRKTKLVKYHDLDVFVYRIGKDALLKHKL